jgi:hypothetical protein
MRRLTRTEGATAIAAVLLIGSCGFAVIMARIIANLFFVMYSDAQYPRLTELFLLADRWGFFVPLLPGIPTYLSWRRGRLDSDGHVLSVIMHAVSAAVLIVVAVGIVLPLLTSNWGMSAR